MAADEIDYNIVFPDAGMSGEQHFIVLYAHASVSLAYTLAVNYKAALKMCFFPPKLAPTVWTVGANLA